MATLGKNVWWYLLTFGKIKSQKRDWQKKVNSENNIWIEWEGEYEREMEGLHLGYNYALKRQWGRKLRSR